MLVNLLKTDLLLISKLLDAAGDKFSSQTCNDFDLNFISDSDRKELIRNYHIYNSDPEEFDKNDDYRYFTDFALMHYFADMFKNLANVADN